MTKGIPYFEKTSSPAINVFSGLILASSEMGKLKGSSLKMIKSAFEPGLSIPVWALVAKYLAGFVVMAAKVSFRLKAC